MKRIKDIRRADWDNLSKEKHILKARIERQRQTIEDYTCEIEDRINWQAQTTRLLEAAESAVEYHEERANRYKAYADALAGLK